MILCLLAAILISSCSLGNYMLNIYGSRVDDRATSIVTLPAGDLPVLSENAYSFLILTDAHFGAGKTNKRLDAFLTRYKQLFTSDVPSKDRPLFIINIGDITDNGFQGQADDYLALEKKMRKIALGYDENAEVPDTELEKFKVYATIGNHDLYTQDGWDIWVRNYFPAKKYGTSYYRFTLGSFSYYFLDAGNGTLGQPQLEDLETRLATDATPKIVFLHYPTVLNISSFSLQNTLERNRLLNDFAKSNVRNIFTGHYHPGNDNNFGNFVEKTVKSFGYKEIVLLVHVNDALQMVTYEEISF